jgi:hypothetical protein
MHLDSTLHSDSTEHVVHHEPLTRSRRRSKLRTSLAMFLATVASVAAATVGTISPASASTVNGVATLADGGTDAALTSGPSTTLFTVNLPPGAACDKDSASGGYHVFSYLVPHGTNIAGLTFVGGTPSAGYGLVDTSGTYFGNANTAITTGQIVSLPTDLEWAPLVTDDGLLSTLLSSGSTPGLWDAGIACANSSGALVDNWNTPVTFSASSSDPNGFVFSTGPGTGAPEVPYALALPVLAVGILGGTVVIRRRRSAASGPAVPVA